METRMKAEWDAENREYQKQESTEGYAAVRSVITEARRRVY